MEHTGFLFCVECAFVASAGVFFLYFSEMGGEFENKLRDEIIKKKKREIKGRL